MVSARCTIRWQFRIHNKQNPALQHVYYCGNHNGCKGGGWTDSHHHHPPSMTSFFRVEMTIQRSSLCRRSDGSFAPPPSAHLPFSTGFQTTPENKKAGCYGNFYRMADHLPPLFGPNFFGGCTVKMCMRMRTYPPFAPLGKMPFFLL